MQELRLDGRPAEDCEVPPAIQRVYAAGNARMSAVAIPAAEGLCLQRVFSAPDVRRTLEVGCAYGLSAMFICNSFKEDGYGSWYYSTATSLELQDWAQPMMIVGSRKLIVGPCNLKDNTGNDFDGFYPSFMSPDVRQGHTRLTGKVFFLKGCDTGGGRQFLSRTFTITVDP